MGAKDKAPALELPDARLVVCGAVNQCEFIQQLEKLVEHAAQVIAAQCAELDLLRPSAPLRDR